ncbi:MAG TPA: hypothetical protein VH541_09375 [Gaiellaceae bacterium]|jgi:hypothetical protein
MTAWGSRLPFSLDPLIAEAKRRMRRRRLFVAVIVLLLAGGALGATFAFKGSAAPSGSPLDPSPAKAQLPPLSGLAERKAFCGNRYSTCHSPDGKWSVVYKQTSSLEHPAGHCVLIVTQLATGRRDEIPTRGGCTHGFWIGHSYLFENGGFHGPAGRVASLDPPSRHLKTLVYFEHIVVSPNERWIAGEAQLRPYACGPSPPCHSGPWLVATLSLTNYSCRVVIQGENKTHDQDVAVDRSPWEFVPFPLSPSFKDPVAWRKVVRGGEKLRVVSGPGTGFTRNSRSLIVAKWQDATHPPRLFDKRLVKFNLASLHTPCPAIVAARRP